MPSIVVGQQILVRKLKPNHEETRRYWAKVLAVYTDGVLLEAFFDVEDRHLKGMELDKGDRFIERYYSNRWYNIYEIYKDGEKELKGWYCDIAEPAVFKEKEISFVDLALDMLVLASGTLSVLDWDEFDHLRLNKDQKDKAVAALDELKDLFHPPINFRLAIY